MAVMDTDFTIQNIDFLLRIIGYYGHLSLSDNHFISYFGTFMSFTMKFNFYVCVTTNFIEFF